MESLPTELVSRLASLANAMVDQQAAIIAVAAQDRASGFWFGGGNVAYHPDGFYLVGRYRNHGDSRTGLKLGQRGLELAIFHAPDSQGPLQFRKVQSWSKQQLGTAQLQVLSIEGAAIRGDVDGWELFVSTEKQGLPYPPGLESYLKPGAGVWSIDRLAADSLDGLLHAQPTTVVLSSDPEHWHVKDPNLHTTAGGDLQLIYCTHPFGWSSSNTAVVTRSANVPEEAGFSEPTYNAIPRGNTWDVAMTRTTCVIDLPAIKEPQVWGEWTERRISLVFYDGGESLRAMEEHDSAVRRPRGYSCEELGGVAYMLDDDFGKVRRISTCFPQFVSPCGTGCSRYVQSVWTEHRGFTTTWQQSQDDHSQPLVIHMLGADEAADILNRA